MSDEITFLPWLRRGLAQAVENDDPLGGGLPRGGALDAWVDVEQPAHPPDVRLRGPEAVTGLSAAQMLRSEPRPDSTDVEPNYFPLVELAAPDLPWMFTPARAEDEQGRLRPWLVLVVVREQEGVSSRPVGDRCPFCGSSPRPSRPASCPTSPSRGPGRTCSRSSSPRRSRRRSRAGAARCSPGCSARGGCVPTAPGSPASCPRSTRRRARARPAAAGRRRASAGLGPRGARRHDRAARLPPLALHHRARRATSRRSAGA